MVHELSSCLARTAEQQQLLADAARLLTRGEVVALPYLHLPRAHLIMMIMLLILQSLARRMQYLTAPVKDTATISSAVKVVCSEASIQTNKILSPEQGSIAKWRR